MPRSYHHISYALRVEVQCVLHIPLIWLVVNPSNIVTWHAFLLFHSWCLSFSTMGWWEKLVRDVHSFTLVHGKGLGNITKGINNYSTCVGFSKTFNNGTRSYSTSINTIRSHTCTCSCRGVCLSNAHIGSQHFYNPSAKTHCDFSPSSSIGWGWPPPFCQHFHPKMDLVLDKKAFISILPLSPQLSFYGLLGMLYELLKDWFIPNNFTTRFDLFF